MEKKDKDNIMICNFDNNEPGQKSTHSPLGNVNVKHVRLHYQLLGHKDLGVTELRTFDKGPEVAYTDNEEDFVRLAMERAGKVNVYVGCNPRPLELFDIAPNSWNRAEKGSCASDEQIEFITAAFFDVDPVRPKGEPATEKEHSLALGEVNRVLSSCGYSGGITASSGNGGYIFFPIRAVSVEKDSAAQYRAWWKKFIVENNGNPGALRWDPVFNLSRVMRVIGTKNLKGNATEERPQRVSAFISMQETEPSERIATEIEMAEPDPTVEVKAIPLEDIPKELPERFKALLSGDSKVQALWDGTGKPRDTDISPSGYDWACLSEAYYFGIRGERELASILKARLIKTNRLGDKGKAYIQRTISKFLSEQKGKHEKKRASNTKRGAASRELPVIQYVFNRDRVRAPLLKIAQVLIETKKFFNYFGDMVFIDKERGAIRVTEKNLNGVLSPHLEISFHKVEGTGKIRFKRFGVLPENLVKAFVNSPEVIAALPRLKLFTRSPLFTEDYKFIGEPGYHPEEGIFYGGEKVAPAEGTEELARTLKHFCWKDAEADKSNFIGMVLTGATMPRWQGKHPMMAIDGNRPGVGKSLLAKVLSILIDGKPPSTISFNPNDEELEKTIATCIEGGVRVIIIDNAKAKIRAGEIYSRILERCITDSILNFRRLGTNTSISRPNDVIFILTMNDTKLVWDLRRRQVPINLLHEGNVEERIFPIADMEEYVMEHRMVILAEVAGIITRWIEAGKPPCEEDPRHSINQSWALEIGAILEYSGLRGFLSNMKESQERFDPDFETMMEIVEKHHGIGKEMKPQEWAALLQEDVLEERLRNRRGEPKSLRAQATIVGTLFKQYVGVTFETTKGAFVLRCKDLGRGHGTLYWIELLTPG